MTNLALVDRRFRELVDRSAVGGYAPQTIIRREDDCFAVGRPRGIETERSVQGAELLR